MDKSAFQMLKNNQRTNALDLLHDTPIVNYGRIIKVIDVQTVVVEAVVQTSLSAEVYTVTLLNLSSALLEINAYPKLGDTVLLLFLQRYDSRMFVQDSVHSPNAAGYNRFSGVGVLAATVKGFAGTLIHLYEAGEQPVMEINSSARLLGTFNAEAALTFCRAVFDSGDEALISVVFGEGRPYMARFLSRVERQYGFWEDAEGNLQELDAAVTEAYSRYAPISKDIQGSQACKIGVDRDGNDTEAPVHVVLGGKADISLESASGFTGSFGKPVSLALGEDAGVSIESESGLTGEFKKAVSVTTEEKIKLANKTETAGKILSDLIQAVADAVTLGSATTQTMNPATVAALQAIKTRCEALLEV
jgi:hypothetical protein